MSDGWAMVLACATGLILGATCLYYGYQIGLERADQTRRYQVRYGALGEKWSELRGNESLPDRVKALIDTPDFQESNLRGLADLEAGRSRPLDEFLAEWKATHKHERRLRRNALYRADGLPVPFPEAEDDHR